MTSMTVKELWRYPVKSMGGEQLDTATLGPLGIDGDRSHGIRDLATGNVLTARRSPDLLFASARIEANGEVVITLPDGTETADDAALSSWLGSDVALVAPSGDGATYENPMDFENDDDWISWQGPGETFHDGRVRVSLISTASLRGWDGRRFRSNIVLDGAGEDELTGSTVTVGGATLSVFKQIDRCVMVTRPQPGLDRDLAVLKDLIRDADNKLSVGAVIESAGTVTVGDTLAVG